MISGPKVPRGIHGEDEVDGNPKVRRRFSAGIEAALRGNFTGGIPHWSDNCSKLKLSIEAEENAGWTMREAGSGAA